MVLASRCLKIVGDRRFFTPRDADVRIFSAKSAARPDYDIASYVAFIVA
jgi:hypothetical protein